MCCVGEHLLLALLLDVVCAVLVVGVYCGGSGVVGVLGVGCVTGACLVVGACALQGGVLVWYPRLVGGVGVFILGRLPCLWGGSTSGLVHQ